MVIYRKTTLSILPPSKKTKVDLFEISKRSYHVKQEEYNLFLERKIMYKLFRDNMFMDEPEFQTLLSYGDFIPLFNQILALFRFLDVNTICSIWIFKFPSVVFFPVIHSPTSAQAVHSMQYSSEILCLIVK